MDGDLRAEATWHLASRLVERAALTCGFDRASGACRKPTYDQALARRRQAHWRSGPPFDRRGELQRRLWHGGLDSALFTHILGLDADAMAQVAGGPPPWTRALEDLLPDEKTPSQPQQEPSGQPGGVEALAALIEPLLERAAHRLRSRVTPLLARSDPVLTSRDAVDRLFVPYLRWLLLRPALPALVLELNVARIEGRLGGDDQAERFAQYCSSLRQRRTALTIYREYPVLARLLLGVCDDFVAATSELLDRAARDRYVLAAAFDGGRRPGPLVEIRPGLGDRHRHGRSVAQLVFDSGLRTVYKPRSLALDLHFQEVLGWMNERGFQPPLGILRSINRGRYGWTEFVAAEACTDVSAARRFYRRLGGQLALFHVLGGTDLHLENLIASGEQPICVDLETLFHPQPEILPRTLNDIVAQALLGSVLRTGLLPERYWGADEFSGVELSAVAGREGQRDVLPSRFWDRVGSDEMRAVQRFALLQGGRNLPRIGDRTIDGRAYRRSFEAGFTAAYELLLEHRTEVLSSNGWLASFAGAEVRFLVRPTRTYQVVLEKSYHPDYLRDGIDRDWLLDRLWMPRPEKNLANRQQVGALFSAELDDLQADCIPYFTTTTTSQDLVTSRGETIPRYFTRSAMEVARERVAGLSTSDLDRQRWMIRVAFAKLSSAGHYVRLSSRPRCGAENGVSAPTVDQLLDAASRVGDRLAELSVVGKGRAGWLTLCPNDNRSRWAIKVAGLDLVRGLPGIVLFLNSLAALDRRRRFDLLARQAVAGLDDVMDEYEAAGGNGLSEDWVGAFEGWGGVVYALTWAYRRSGNPADLERALRAADRIEASLANDRMLNVARGAAGALLSLLCLDRVAPATRALDLARRCGEHLVAAAERRGSGESDWSPSTSLGRRAEFATGGAGVGYALCRLGTRVGEARFLLPGRAALLGAASPTARRSAAITWCRGQAGLAAASVHRATGASRERIRSIGETFRCAPTARDDSLCHGDAARLDLLLTLGRASDDDVLLRQAAAVSRRLVDRVKRGAWRCGEVAGAEVPGLMTGLSGIGYTLLRAAAPERVPSVLTLEPPSIEA